LSVLVVGSRDFNFRSFILMNTQIKLTFRDARCPVFFADAQPVPVWSADGVVRVQFRAVHLTDPASEGETSPLVEVVMPITVFAALQDAVNKQWQELERQGVKRVAITGPVAAESGGKH
jgi:hypothetical protein